MNFIIITPHSHFPASRPASHSLLHYLFPPSSPLPPLPIVTLPPSPSPSLLVSKLFPLPIPHHTLQTLHHPYPLQIPDTNFPKTTYETASDEAACEFLCKKGGRRGYAYLYHNPCRRQLLRFSGGSLLMAAYSR